VTYRWLCLAKGCRVVGHHRGDCVEFYDETCRGCLPREAAPGLNLCWPHRDHIVQDAKKAAEVWEELSYQLVPAGGAGEAVSGTRDRGLKLSEPAIKARADIESVLASWADLVVEERGFTAPKRDVQQLGQFIADNATWLAAHPSAADCVRELRELAWGRPWRVAYPDGVRTHQMSGGCPADGCEGSARAVFRRASSLLPSGEIVCDLKPEHRWASHEWLGLMKKETAC
jgi:hypothetical protein